MDDAMDLDTPQQYRTEDRLQFLEEEIASLEPKFQRLKDLRFVNPPKWDSQYVPEDEDLEPNSGPHRLLQKARANDDYLDMEHRLSDILHDVKDLATSLNERTASYILAEQVHLRAFRALQRLRRQKEKDWRRQLRVQQGGVDTTRYNQPSHPDSPILLVMYSLVLMMTVFFHLPRRGSRLLLAGLRCILRLIPSQTNVAEAIFQDTRSVLSHYPLDPITHLFICCPRCYHLYPSEDGAPDTCADMPTPTSKACGELLWKIEHRGNKKHRTPVLTYEPQDIKHCVGRWLSRPHIEDLLENAFRRNPNPNSMTDCWDARVLRRIAGPDRKRFLPGHGNVLRLVFGISVDSFNPFHLKTAKQSASSTGIWLFCLNFPLHLRFLEENVCLAGVVPGPGKPSLDQINHILDLVIDVFCEFWAPGVFYTQTYKYNSGRMVEGILVPSLSDMLAIRQIGGFTAVTSHHFCTGCDLDIKDIENLNKEDWPTRTAAEFVRTAIQWRDASSEEEREKITNEHGIRWSPLLRLPYYNPIRFSTTETNHLFFLGLVAHHCRKAFRIDVDVEGGLAIPRPLNPDRRPEDGVMERCYSLIKQNSEGLLAHLQKQKHAVLLYICAELDLRRVGTKYQLAQQIVQWRSGVNVDSVPQFAPRATEDERAHDPPTGNTRMSTDIEPESEAESESDFITDSEAIVDDVMDDDPVQDIPKRKKSARDRFDPGTPPTEAQAKAILQLKTRIDRGHTWTTIQRVPLPIFQYACLDFGLPYDQKKHALYQALDAKSKESPLNPLAQPKVGKGKTSVSGGNIGEGLDGESNAVLGLFVMTETWADMAETQIPSWMNKAPADWGTFKRGKISSGQWQAISLVHLPVTLIRLWGKLEIEDRRRQLLDNYMMLVQAVTLANLHTITPAAIQQYEHTITSYLEGYLHLFKDTTLHPVHHVAMHHGDEQRDFGPVRACKNGSYYERHIHQLQETNSNHKFGELESTMLKEACRRSNLRALLLDNPALEEHAPELMGRFREYLEEDSRGTRLANMMHTVRPAADLAYHRSSAKPCLLPNPIFMEIQRLLYQSRPLPANLPKDGLCISHLSLRGVRYCVHDHLPRDSDVIYRMSVDGKDIPAAGQITQIYVYTYTARTSGASHSKTTSTFMVVKPYRPLSDDMTPLNQPYLRYGFAGGWLCTRHVLDPILIESGQVMSHLAKTPVTVNDQQGSLELFHILPLDKLMQVPDLVKSEPPEMGEEEVTPAEVG